MGLVQSQRKNHEQNIKQHFATLGTRGFPRVRREFSVLAEGRHIFGRRPKPRAAKPREKQAFRAGHYKDLTETGNRARKVSGTQGSILQVRSSKLLF